MPRPKSPVPYLAPSDKTLLRRKLTAPNNLDCLLTLICWYVRDNLLRAFPPPDPPGVRAYLVRRMGEALHGAILEKLRQYHPKDASRNDETVLRYYPDQAGALLNQALGYLIDLWRDDFIQHPIDTLATRCQRLLSSLAHLPPMRGKSAHGNTSKLFALVMYEDSLRLLNSLSRKGKDLRKRKTALKDLLCSPPKDIHPAVKRAVSGASDDDLDEWSFLSKKEIVLEIAVRAVQDSSHLSPDWLRQLIRDLKAQARRLDDALKLS